MQLGTVADWAVVLVTAGGVCIALWTLGILRSQTELARVSAEAAKTAADATLLEQRAYVTMSHQPPGLIADAPVNGTVDVHAAIAVENKGHTPARVINAHASIYVSANPLPDQPPYDEPAGPSDIAYLAAGERFFINARFPMPEDRWQQVQNGFRSLWLLSYVDYLDVFNNTHRAGYARKYDPKRQSPNNLPFETKPGYNYDTPLNS